VRSVTAIPQLRKAKIEMRKSKIGKKTRGRPVFDFRFSIFGFYALMLIPRTELKPSPSASQTVGCA
jgi:hypothetical protein